MVLLILRGHMYTQIIIMLSTILSFDAVKSAMQNSQQTSKRKIRNFTVGLEIKNVVITGMPLKSYETIGCQYLQI